jgi:hypothetical protein
MKRVLVISLALALGLARTAAFCQDLSTTTRPSPELAYLKLLTLFPEDKDSLGLDYSSRPDAPRLPQPMTYGLVLSAECLRQRHQANPESKRRIQNCVAWLLDNSDLDRDGLPGWGVPEAWDAFNDGSVNPPNHEYTITTAFVMQGLMDALVCPGVLSPKKLARTRKILKETALSWISQLWTEGTDEGFFQYSAGANDRYFVINASAMFLGVLSRLLDEQPGLFGTGERESLSRIVDLAARGVVKEAQIRDAGPFWKYYRFIRDPSRDGLNDLCHHGFVIWGMELYRKHRGQAQFAWSTDQSIRSIDAFFKGDAIMAFPQDVDYAQEKDRKKFTEMPSPLWGTGMMLAIYGAYSKPQQAERCFRIIDEQYGPFSQPTSSPHSAPKSQQRCLQRMNAFLLWGIAYSAFR